MFGTLAFSIFFSGVRFPKLKTPKCSDIIWFIAISSEAVVIALQRGKILLFSGVENKQKIYSINLIHAQGNTNNNYYKSLCETENKEQPWNLL